ncbi:MAG: hypothetical protein E6Q76_07475 [Rhizobium sp.]|nr:MAG: hypothetical protein E6Q76_07475 [Rhizobium sp.]
MNPLKKWYDKLSPKGKQYVLYGGLIVGLGVVVLIFMDAPKQEIHHQTTSKTVFTDSSVKKLSDDAMESEVRSLKQQNNDLKKDLEYLHTQMTRGAGKDATLDDLDRLRLEMKTELAKQAEESRQRQYLDNAQAKTAAKPAPSPDDADDADAGDSDTSPAPAYARPSTGASPTTTSGAPPANNAPSSSGIRIIGSVAPAASPATVTPAVAGKTAAPAATPRNGASGEGVKGSNSADADEVFIPAGSMIRGILLSGMDAPTSKNARQDPYPALIRITDDAILPNLNRADVKECFVIAAG